jgi:tight adherence protein C
MNTGALLIAALICAMLVTMSAWALLLITREEERVDQRLKGANTRVLHEPMSGQRVVALVMAAIGRIGAMIVASGLLSRRTVNEFEQTLAASGVAARSSLGLFLGAKMLLLFSLPAAAFLLAYGFDFDEDAANSFTLLAGIAGLLGPDMVIRRLRTRYLSAVEGGLADTLDLMLICAQSGLSLQPALVRVEAEIRDIHPQLAWELTQTATELQINADSRTALTNLGVRTGLDSLRRLTATLAQTLQYGTPLSEALRALSLEMRQEVLTRFEEKAAKLPIMLTVPMIVFILPCVFIVVGGPAVIQLMHNFG